MGQGRVNQRCFSMLLCAPQRLASVDAAVCPRQTRAFDAGLPPLESLVVMVCNQPYVRAGQQLQALSMPGKSGPQQFAARTHTAVCSTLPSLQCPASAAAGLPIR